MLTTMLLLVAVTGTQVLQTPDGVRFGIVGAKPARPGPALILFANSLEETLQNPDYSEIGRCLAERGFLQVSMDLPSHGAELPANEKNS